MYDSSVKDGIGTPRQKKTSGTSRGLFSMLKRKPSKAEAISHGASTQSVFLKLPA